MFRFLSLILALSAVAYGDLLPEALQNPDRIIGGTSANIADVPYQLSLRRSNSHFCGAILISPTWAITAAHCTISETASRLTLLAGTSQRTSGGQVRAVRKLVVHTNYNSRTLDSDISALQVASPFSINNNVRPAGLPNQGAGVASGAYAIVSGWGTTREGGSIPSGLQQVWVPIVAQSSCNSAYSGQITNNMLCAGYFAGGKDACQGDSGGPLVINGQLIGVVSWGRGCARANYPGVYTRVSSFRNWIKQISGV